MTCSMTWVNWSGRWVASYWWFLPNACRQVRGSLPSTGIEDIFQEELAMQIQINSDHNFELHEALAGQVSEVVESALSRVSDHITRVEVHLSDENGNKKGPNDQRCMMEARLEGCQPIAVTHQAASLDEAVDGAADELS